MSDVSADRFRRADALFEAALDLPAEERAAFVDRACAGDDALGADVRRLLHAHQRSGDFMESPAVELAAPLLHGRELLGSDLPAAPVRRPERVGPFRLVREIGRGGMGAVYLAERDDGQFRQRVALKLVRRAGTEPDLVRRFLEERRILALLEHPRIARLIDGGLTDDGQPYFAMEFVEGEPIDRYCDGRSLPVERRLELFGAVCEAVQYAHQHLVVHRDLKPSNILVTPDGQPKLLDFGIAKLLDPLASPDDGPLTRTGLHPMTPEYAAPEQVRGEPVSTATDIYALGVLLYSLLAGRRPYEVRGRSPAETERIICEVDPARPSATFAADTAEAASPDRASRALARGGTPERLRRELSGDLDLIVMRALRKEAARRYPSAAALLEDVQRYRGGHPVLARPDSAAYRARKFALRNRWAVAAAGGIVLMLGAYAVTVTLQREQIRRALVEARLGTQKAEQVTDFMLGLFEAAEGGKALTDTVTARELLSRGLGGARELAGQPVMQAQMLDVIGRLYTQLGEYDRALPLLEEALTIRRAQYGEHHADVATSLENLARVTDEKQDIARTVTLRRQALALRRQLSGPDHRKTLDALWELASTLHRAGDNSAATPLFDEWMVAVARQPRAITPLRAEQLSATADLLELRGERDRAESMLREALAIRRALYGERHHLVASSLTDLGILLDNARRREEAEPLLREAVAMLRATYPDGHPQLARTLRLWGVVLEHLKRFPDAQAPLREALAMQRRFAGEDAVPVALAALDLSYALTMGGQYDEAASLARDAARILRAKLGEGNSMVVFAHVALGDALRGQGQYAAAESLLLAGYKRFEIPKPITRQWRGYTLAALVRLYEAEGRPEQAAKYRALVDAPAR